MSRQAGGTAGGRGYAPLTADAVKVARPAVPATALCAAAIGMMLASAVVLRWRLDKDAALNLEAGSEHPAAPDAAVAHERGPVRVRDEY